MVSQEPERSVSAENSSPRDRRASCALSLRTRRIGAFKLT
jgi:hypothetical protein